MFLGCEEGKLRLEVWEWNKLNALDFVGCTYLDHAYSEARKGKQVDMWRPLTCKGVHINVSVRITLQLTREQESEQDQYVFFICIT